MARVGVPYFTSAVTASPADATETVIATLAGCSVRYPSDHFVIVAVADITPQAAVTSVTLKVRRTSVSGTTVGTMIETPKAAADITRGVFVFACDDAPGDVAGLTYVLTATMTTAGGASVVNAVELIATLTS